MPRLSIVVAAMGLAAITGVLTPATPQAASCSSLQIVYARGTFEPAIPYGLAIGNTLVSDLQADVPGITAVGLSYPADLESSSSTVGSTALLNYITSEAAQCPNQKFVLAGYSQGANVVAMSLGLDTSEAVVGGPSAAQISESLASHITAVLMIAPPYNQVGLSVPPPYSAITDQFCASGDIFCSPEPNLILGIFIHLFAYNNDLSSAAVYAARNYNNGVVA